MTRASIGLMVCLTWNCLSCRTTSLLDADETDTDTELDTGTDADTDTDTDADTDTDTDADSDTDTDVDSDTDTDADADGDSDADSDTDTCVGAACLVPTDDGTDTLEPAETDGSCEEGKSECVENRVYRCDGGVFSLWDDCEIQQKTCTMILGEASCWGTSDGDADTDGDADADTDTDADSDSDSDTESGPCPYTCISNGVCNGEAHSGYSCDYRFQMCCNEGSDGDADADGDMDSDTGTDSESDTDSDLPCDTTDAPAQLIPGADGWLDKCSNRYGFQGHFFSAVDTGGSSVDTMEILPGEGEICVSGYVSEVIDGDYADTWGALFGFDLCRNSATEDPPEKLYSASQCPRDLSGLTGFSMTITGSASPELRIQFDDGTSPAPFIVWEHSGQTVYRFADSSLSWDSTSGPADPDKVKAVYFWVAAAEGSDGAFDFCVSDIDPVF